MCAEQVLSPSVRSVTVRRRGRELDQDLVVVEEPLEIRFDGTPLVVTMRTPGSDEELAAGFLHAEGMIARGDEVETIRRIPGTNTGGSQLKVTNFAGDRIEITRKGESPATTPALTERRFRATAACGVCGKDSIDALEQLLPSITNVKCPSELLEALPTRLKEAQELFASTGGIHAAGIFSLTGDLLCLREDIGRHNAVDKVIGHFVLNNKVPLHNRILVVSGRAGFELVQKALKASIPIMVSVGAASSVAIEMATNSGMTLYSFAGHGRGNLHIAEPSDRTPSVDAQ